jgi:8-oxo-dGTP pyrophosphatase MutT (NUDIX family)
MGSESAPSERSPAEVSAGGVVFAVEGSKLRVAMLRDRFGVWTFPKGHVERGEAPAQAAVREVAEEIGLPEVSVVAELPTTHHTFSARGQIRHKRVHWFLLRARRAEALQAGDDALEAGWFRPTTARRLLGYNNLKAMARRAIRLAEQQTGTVEP